MHRRFIDNMPAGRVNFDGLPSLIAQIDVDFTVMFGTAQEYRRRCALEARFRIERIERLVEGV